MDVDKLEIPFIDIFDRAPDIASKLDAVVASLDANEEGLLFDYAPVADAEQRRFMQMPAPTIRLLAPAGSGKTQSVVNRILYAIGNGQRPDSFLVLTFDNAASLSLTENSAPDSLHKG